MADWRTCYAIDTLLKEVNQLWPHRSTASDGTKGDAAHAARVSQHNPNYRGVVTAVDITHDWTGGPNGNELIDYLLAVAKAGHPSPWYFVWDHHIYDRIDGWVKRSYNGDPHTNHIHVSMLQRESEYDSRTPWNLEDEMPLSDSDIRKIAKAVRDEVWGATFDNRGTDDPGDKTTPQKILENDHKRITDMEKVIVKPGAGLADPAVP